MPDKKSKTPPANARARVTDIAAAAGVSTATVDRVLNGRPGVRAATLQKVMKAAAALDYLPESDLYKAMRPRPMQLVFLLPPRSNRYMQMLGDYIGFAEDHLAPFNVRCKYHHIEGFNPRVLAQRLLHYGRQADGVAFMALEHPLVREAVNTLAEEGVHVVTLISDLSNSRRAAYVGMDNRAAGRTAGYLLARFLDRDVTHPGPGRKPGKIAMIAGSLSYRGHEEREMGFQHALEEICPQVQVVGLREGHDDADTNYKQARILLEQYPDLAGMYNIGGASDGVGRALKESGRDQKVVFIGHGLTPDTRGLLIDGTMDAVLTQHPQNMIMNCVRIFGNLRERRDALAGVEAVRISVILRENLP
ncbi:LacI family DNA-binding transcriptional regulator [Herbaspirillum robiniae]|uniref:LacI family transcriptional regulator n=1 Tax=Herbaspirillum robiniae TaxID=2014887 RepID=A0A246WS68_9BURK|nr:LacI family DNA-binding transcriptional regulator [Herbaspirillum robiniae]NUU00597.1 LacI family transcriptional regulator [Herbaspirillum robiniae]OWY29275.1 LacI family transcriptional regulator [Herbaspirillum robiniae]